MIRAAVVYVGLACWPAVACTQSALDLVSLTFAPGPASGEIAAPGSGDAVAPVSGDVSSAAPAVGAAASPPDPDASRDMSGLIASIREAEEEISREEALNGPSSRGLIERLTSIAALYGELGDHSFAIAALERARQIIRVHDGLYSLSQLEIMNTTIDAMEEAGAYFEADSLQAEILELAGRNEDDPRVPSIVAAIADRQMDAVTAYFAAGSWERSIERIEVPGGWDLENIDFLRSSRNKKPLNRLDLAIRELLTNGGYEIGDTLDAQGVLTDTYALVEVINDHNEAGQRREAPEGLIFESKERERDLALSAFRRARRLYSAALQAMLASEAYRSGEYLAVEQKIVDTYHFELAHVALYPGVSTQVSANGRRGMLKRVVYGTGTSVLEAKAVNLMSRGASATEIAKALLEVGDWHLLFSANSRALETYQDAHDLLVREDVPPEAFNELMFPATPVPLPQLASDGSLAFDPAHTYRGYLDMAVETGRFGDVKEAETVNRSVGTSPNVEQRARTHVFETRFRPRFENGEPMRSDRFDVRYYYDYSEWE